MLLSVVMPVYNEAATVAKAVERVRAAAPDCEIVVVDDGSTDGTARQLDASLPQDNLKIVQHPVNRGKGAALRTGFSSASGDIILIQDADLEYSPLDYPRLLEPILNNEADVVYGSRFLGGPHRVLFFWHYVGNKFLTLLSNMLTNLNLTDMETGYKVFRREVLDSIQLRSNRFGFEPEVTAKVARKKWRMYEVPVQYHGRTYEQGKKITWKDGALAFFYIIWYRFF
jgi:glycosyltransferase involved in cell wall biosynthesis